VSKDGYFLEKTIYHQAEITVQGNAKIEKVIMAPSILTEDIVAGQSRNIYIKTDIPTGANVQEYESCLRTWWGEAE
jgi:hypothetical protein